MREELGAAVKAAMKAGDKERLSTLRMMSAAVKDKDIAVRYEGRPDGASDGELAEVFAKLVKSREDSAKLYDEGGRPELAAKERAEIAVVREFMPKQMDEAEARAAIAALVAELGAAGPKDMGRVMAALKARFAGEMDFGAASGLVKAALAG
ncbi:MAG: GatB/YqeY domain-containing protein [Phyllobacteriaceae bacterium]|nr:GatB/YqeY domain-containing protein [Phyllobacteriaceae bacterium]